MIRGEKILSFVKYEKELESDYRRHLDDVKRPDEVGKVFVEFAFKLIKMVKSEIPDGYIEEIGFDPESDVPFKLGNGLKEALSDLYEKSDLPAILERMARSAQNRYKKLKKDDERTDLFRLGDNAKPH